MANRCKACNSWDTESWVTRCRYCGEKVIFYRCNSCGGCVFLEFKDEDEAWVRHKEVCTGHIQSDLCFF